LTTSALVEEFFRHEYGKLVATLSRRVGTQFLDDVEDAVQSTLMKALQTWPAAGLPENPSAWLFRVAHNDLMGMLRQRTGRNRILEQLALERSKVPVSNAEVFLESEIEDDLLRMLFVCCDGAIPVESQLVFALKTLCGFDIREIAIRLFTTEANIYKRFERACSRLRELPLRPGDLKSEDCVARLSSVHSILYLMFTEGYLSVCPEETIRRDLCSEAIRLTTLLANHPSGLSPETFALLALMHLQSARINSRLDAAGGLLLLEEQNRSLWDQREIEIGMKWLGKCASGEQFTRYHAEAGIAAEHCLAPSFKETRWDKIICCYSLLERTAPSAIHRLNRAVAVAEFEGPEAGLATLEGLAPPTWLEGSYMWVAVLADLQRRCGNTEQATHYRETAINLAPTTAIKDLLKRRLKDAPISGYDV
jgi:RNA polymerase sigma-70 factor (ECF subfamily)